MKKGRIFAVLIVLILITISFTGCFGDDDNDKEGHREIKEATIDEINVTISFKEIRYDNVDKTIILDVGMKNEANEKRKLITHYYIIPSESSFYYIIANGTEYKYITDHSGGGEFDNYTILNSNESFYYEFEIWIKTLYFDTINITIDYREPFNITVESYFIYIEIPLYSRLNTDKAPLRLYKASNIIEIKRELIV